MRRPLTAAHETAVYWLYDHTTQGASMGLRALLKRFRSAITGRFVSKKYAAEHPDTTIAES